MTPAQELIHAVAQGYLREELEPHISHDAITLLEQLIVEHLGGTITKGEPS